MLKTVLKLFLSMILLIAAGFLFYNNFISNKRQAYVSPKTFEAEQVYTKFDLDVLEDKVFKDLIQAKLIENNLDNKEDTGRANPFIKF